MQKVSMANHGPPNAIQDLFISCNSDRLLLKRHAVIQESFEHLTTRALTGRTLDTFKISRASAISISSRHRLSPKYPG